MRFFSNDARETPDDEVTTDERPDRVKSDPVAVPVQRPAPSPWAAGPTPERPAGPGPERSADSAPDPDDAGPVAGRPPFHDPGPQPTAFGASTVSGAVAASAVANPLDDTRDGTDRRTDAASGVADDRTVAPGDGARPDSLRPDSLRSDNTRPDTFRASTFRADGGRTDTAGPGNSGPGSARPGSFGPGIAGPGSAGPGSAGPESTRPGFAGDTAAVRVLGGQQADAPPRSRTPQDDDPVDVALNDGGTFADPVVASPADGATTAGTDRPDTDRFDTGRPGTARFDTDRPDRLDADRPDGFDTDRSGTDRSGTDRSGTDRSGTGASVAAVPVDLDVPPAAGRRGGPDDDRTTTSNGGRTSADDERTDNDGTDNDRISTAAGDATMTTDTDRATTDRATTDRATPEPAAPARSDTGDVAAKDRDGVPGAGDSGEKLPGSVPTPELGPLFPDASAHEFRDRWRDVQLRFVDDPKAAADEAVSLVDEVVDALAAGLKAQREQLTTATTDGSTSDTEQLRVRLRSYRDLLDRLLTL